MGALHIISRSQKSPIPAKRITNIIEYMTFEVFKYSVRGLYECDKMTFTVLLALKIDMACNKVQTSNIFNHNTMAAFVPKEIYD